MHKTVVINVVGLTRSLIGLVTPRLASFLASGKSATIGHVTPAVTCSVQSTYLTGMWPSDHGIVGNGWYVRDECEVRFWRQSNKLVQRPKIWDIAKQRDPSFTCANLFWWFNMYSSADVSVTPRPIYPADGRKIPDIYTHPPRLREELQKIELPFPLFQFWGPGTDISSTEWIEYASYHADAMFKPTLTLIYLPHLDYCLQRFGPDPIAIAKDLREIDAVCGRLIDNYAARGARIVFLSEYGISRVSRPIHLNRRLREAGLLVVREELGREILDPGASAAFAVADHQIAHVYVNDRGRIDQVRTILESTPGVARVLDDAGKREHHLDHDRAGDLVALAESDAWFTYYYWLDDARAPDFARTVDIHRKPGYDPVELFLDPSIRFPRAKIGLKLLKKKLGFRTLMDVIPLDANLVRGSHGVRPASDAEAPLFITSRRDLLGDSTIAPTDVCDLILRHLTDG